MARRFHAIYAQAMQQNEKDNENCVQAPGFLQRRLRGTGLRYYDNCELTMYTKRQRQLKDTEVVGIGEILADPLGDHACCFSSEYYPVAAQCFMLQGEPAQIIAHAFGPQTLSVLHAPGK